MLFGASLGEGETQGLVIVNDLANRLTEGTEEEYEDLIGQSVILTVRLPRGETKDFATEIIGIRKSVTSRTVDLGLKERIEIKAWWYGRPDTLSTDGYDNLIIKAIDENAVPTILEAAEAMNLRAQSLGAFLEIANRVLTILQALLGSVGGLALLVATLGVANTMMMAIYERTKEIGVLKALGATNGEVRRMFTADAMLLGIIGGFVGVIFGTLLGRLVDWIGHRYMEAEGMTGVGTLSIVPPWLAIGALIFAAFIGILGGLYPAARAARLDPVAALRHE
jgi:putative ABC transport system permease protein